ncbi:MAG: hypothetical protein LBJ69_02915 [Holosporales bacterium]|nr:hypothetical protein [Holosporales bacterium]
MIEAIMTKLGLPTYGGNRQDNKAYEEYLETPRHIARAFEYIRMAKYDTIDQGVNYWLMVYQPPDAPDGPYNLC